MDSKTSSGDVQAKQEPQDLSADNNASNSDFAEKENTMHNSTEEPPPPPPPPPPSSIRRNDVVPPPPKKMKTANMEKILPEALANTILPLAMPAMNLFFELFYEGPYDLSLINRSWGIHRVPPPNRAIVVSEIAYALFNVSMSPSYKKQVILTDNLQFKAFVLDKLVVEKTLDIENTREDFEQSFAEIVNMVICKGGSKIEENQDVLLRCAYKDFYSNRWRHKSCTIIIEKGEEVCRPCTYLDKFYL